MLRGLFFQPWGSLTSLRFQARDPQPKVPPGGLVLRIFFFPEKIHRSQQSFNPRSLDLDAKKLSRDHRGRLSWPLRNNVILLIDFWWIFENRRAMYAPQRVAMIQSNCMCTQIWHVDKQAWQVSILILVGICRWPLKENFILLLVDRALDEVEYAKCKDRVLLIVLNSEKLAHYNSGCCQEVCLSIYFFIPHPLRY